MERYFSNEDLSTVTVSSSRSDVVFSNTAGKKTPPLHILAQPIDYKLRFSRNIAKNDTFSAPLPIMEYEMYHYANSAFSMTYTFPLGGSLGIALCMNFLMRLAIS